MDTYGIALDGWRNMELYLLNALMGGFFSFGSCSCYSLLIVECDHHPYLKNVKTNHDSDVSFFSGKSYHLTIMLCLTFFESFWLGMIHA